MKSKLLLSIQALGCCIGASCGMWFFHGFGVGILIEPDFMYRLAEFTIVGSGVLICLATAIEFGYYAVIEHIDSITRYRKQHSGADAEPV